MEKVERATEIIAKMVEELEELGAIGFYSNLRTPPEVHLDNDTFLENFPIYLESRRDCAKYPTEMHTTINGVKFFALSSEPFPERYEGSERWCQPQTLLSLK